MLTSAATSARRPTRPRPAQVPRAPAAGSRPHRWVGTLRCSGPACGRELAEVFADDNNLTYLPQIGGGRVRDILIECPHCGAVRQFRSVASRPATGPLGHLPPAPDSVYDISTNEQQGVSNPP